MDMNIDEQWVEVPKVQVHNDSIVSVSNTGKYRRADGTVGCLELRQRLRYHGEQEHCYWVIAEHFLITVKRPDQICIDHITHHPTDYNVNDVRNLRWCNNAENNRFEEARKNKSKAQEGRTGEKHQHWKGDSAKAKAKYRRALNEYRANPTQENLAALEEARLMRNEYNHHLRRAKKSRQ